MRPFAISDAIHNSPRHKYPADVKTWIILLVLAISCSVTGCANASNTLATNSAPTPMLFAGATGCLANASQQLPAKDAAQFCLDLRKLEVERGTKVAESAARAVEGQAGGKILQELVRCMTIGGCNVGGQTYRYGQQYMADRINGNGMTGRNVIYRSQD